MCVALCCSVLLQCVAVYRSVLQRVLQCVLTHVRRLLDITCVAVLQSVAECGSVLQCVLQCVAVCCSVLQCDAVCCSMMQCDAVCVIVQGYHTDSAGLSHGLMCVRQAWYLICARRAFKRIVYCTERAVEC